MLIVSSGWVSWLENRRHVCRWISRNQEWGSCTETYTHTHTNSNKDKNKDRQHSHTEAGINKRKTWGKWERVKSKHWRFGISTWKNDYNWCQFSYDELIHTLTSVLLLVYSGDIKCDDFVFNTSEHRENALKWSSPIDYKLAYITSQMKRARQKRHSLFPLLSSLLHVSLQ